jgi:ribosomal-protein-alanine N-acetyltransferase
MQVSSEDVLFKTFPVLHTERLDLIEISQAHLHDLFRIFGNGAVTTFYNVVTLQKEEEAQKFIDHFRSRFHEKAGIRWGIALKESTTIIGTLGYNNFAKHHRANIGYDLLPEHWNNGYITEAL